MSTVVSVAEHLQDFSISDQSIHINTLTARTGRWLALFFYEQGSCSLVLMDLWWDDRQHCRCELNTGASINPQIHITSQHISPTARQLRQRWKHSAVSGVTAEPAGWGGFDQPGTSAGGSWSELGWVTGWSFLRRQRGLQHPHLWPFHVHLFKH